MLDFFLLLLLLVFVFRFFTSALRRPSGANMSDHGNVITIHTKEEWDSKLQQGTQEKKIVVVDFTATWCGPCRNMAPIFVDLSKKHSNLIFVKVDVDQLPDIAAEWEVQAMPTFVFIKEGRLVHKIVGANKDELEKKSVFFAANTHA